MGALLGGAYVGVSAGAGAGIGLLSEGLATAKGLTVAAGVVGGTWALGLSPLFGEHPLTGFLGPSPLVGAAAAVGVGFWIDVTEHMSSRAAAYQEQITGNSIAQSYLVNGVKFDGVGDGVLLDAKGPGYAKFLDKDGNFRSWWSGREDLLDQAERQVGAAGGTPIEWHVAESEAAEAMRRLLAENGIEGINVIHTAAE